MLEFAYTLYSDELCSCGHRRSICQHPDNEGWFDAEKTVCHAQAAVDIKTGAKNYKAEPGEIVYTTYRRPDNKPLPPLNSGKDAAAKSDQGGEEPTADNDQRGSE